MAKKGAGFWPEAGSYYYPGSRIRRRRRRIRILTDPSPTSTDPKAIRKLQRYSVKPHGIHGNTREYTEYPEYKGIQALRPYWPNTALRALLYYYTALTGLITGIPVYSRVFPCNPILPVFPCIPVYSRYSRVLPVFPCIHGIPVYYRYSRYSRYSTVFPVFPVFPVFHGIPCIPVYSVCSVYSVFSRVFRVFRVPARPARPVEPRGPFLRGARCGGVCRTGCTRVPGGDAHVPRGPCPLGTWAAPPAPVYTPSGTPPPHRVPRRNGPLGSTGLAGCGWGGGAGADAPARSRIFGRSGPVPGSPPGRSGVSVG